MLEELLEVPDGVHALEARDVVTADDYAKVFAPLVDRVRREGRRLRCSISSVQASPASHQGRLGGLQVGRSLSPVARRLRTRQ